MMSVGIAKLDGDLTARAPASLEIDRHLVLAQVIARTQHFIERRHLEGQMIEIVRGRRVLEGSDQRNAVVIGIAAHEHHAAFHHLVRVDIRHAKAEHAGVEAHAAIEIRHVEHHVPDLVDLERRVRRTRVAPQ